MGPARGVLLHHEPLTRVTAAPNGSGVRSAFRFAR